MKAVIAEKLGSFREVLKLTDLPPIDAIPASALHVRVTACGMGFPDLLQVEGKYQLVAEPPFVPAWLCDRRGFRGGSQGRARHR